MATIRPEDLPAASSVNPASALIVDNGITVEKATPILIVDAAIPLASQAEAEAGANNVKRMTPLRAKQGFDAFLLDAGASALGYTSSFAGSTATTVEDFLNRIISLGNGAVAHSDGTDILTGSPRWFIGNNTPSSDDSALLIGRSLSGSYATGAHGVRDETSYLTATGTGLFGYASFDSIVTLGGAAHWDHVRGGQFRPSYTGSNLINEVAALYAQPNHTGAGVVDGMFGLRVSRPTGTGVINIFTALWIDPGVAGRATSTYAIFSTDTTLPSYHGGKWQMGTSPQITAAGFTTYGAFLTHDASGNLLSNPNITIVNGVQTMADTTARILASAAAALDLRATTGVITFSPNGAEKARVDTLGNFLVGVTAAGATAAKSAQFGNGTAPTANIAGVQIWAEGGALKMRGSSGTVTTLGPA